MDKTNYEIAQQTPAKMIVGFLYTCVFGAVAIAPLMELINVIPLVITAIIGSAYVHRFAAISTAIILGIVWLSSFLILWNRLERNFDYRHSLFVMLKWTGIAVAIFLVAIGGHVLLDSILISG